MMKREGFTLIELLAVIVILAIIALIATPIVLNIINDARRSTNERSIEMYASAVKNAIATYHLKEGKAPTTFEDLEEYITYEGTEINCETEELYSDGSIYLASCKVGNTLVEGYTYGRQETVSYKKYENGEVVYFDVTTGESCSDYTETQSNVSVKEGCMKFYAFNDSESSETVNLLLDHNTTATVAWISKGDYISAGGEDLSNDGGICQYGGTCSKTTYGPITLLSQLQSDTGSWKGTETPTNYSLDQSGASSGAKYTIDYTGYKARLISAEEISQITGNTSWDVTSESSSWYYFDSLTTTASETCKYNSDISGCKYGWLYDRTSNSCTDYGCSNNSDILSSGYWTVSSAASYSYLAWHVSNLGNFRYDGYNVENTSTYGLRPVIEVLKSKLS